MQKDSLMTSKESTTTSFNVLNRTDLFSFFTSAAEILVDMHSELAIHFYRHLVIVATVRLEGKLICHYGHLSKPLPHCIIFKPS